MGEEIEQDGLEIERGAFEQIPHWILFHPMVTANGIRLYLILRSFAMGKGWAFPSRRRLAESMGVSMPTLDAAKKCLIEVGAIEVEARMNEGGEQRSNMYLVRWNLPNNLIGGKESSTTPSQESLQGWERNLHTEAYKLNTDQSKADSIDRTPVRKPVDYDPKFEEFWSMYPRHEAKGAARKAWLKAVRVADPILIIAGALRYNNDPNRDPAFTAHASTWLNGERWLDGSLPVRDNRSGQKNAEVMNVIERAALRDMGELES
jgi:hypothetical protein